MTKTEFINEIRTLADKLENGDWYSFKTDKDCTIFANRNYGEMWLGVGKGITIHAKLFNATDEERKEN